VQIDTLFGPYRILSRLGRGGMGEVWLAEDTRLHRQVALKTVRPLDGHDAGSRAQLMREARAAAALNHPNIATVHDVLEDRGEVVIVFEYVEGETLQARIARGRISSPDAVEIGTQIAKALIAAHAQGIVHRDLKPTNIILAAGSHVKVLDFGIARMLSVGTTRTAGHASQSASALGFIGTASYAAPEQLLSSAVDERADLYALGVVLFEMISGERPFMGNDPVQLASSKLAHDAPPLSSTVQQVPSALNGLVASLLSRERNHRPASAAALLAQLHAIYGSAATVAMPAPRMRRPLVLIAVAVVIMMLGGFGVWQARRVGAAASTNVSSLPVIAVLPLTNVSGDPSRDFVAAGISESLISALAASPSLTVLSRAAVMESLSRKLELSKLAVELGVSYLIEGALQQSGDELRVTLNLVKPDRSIAWARSFDGTLSRVFDLQTRMTVALGEELSVGVTAEGTTASAPPTDSTEALAAYWEGKAFLDRHDVKGNLEAAASAFSRAVTMDPGFALAHAALGEVYWRQYDDTKDASWVQKAMSEGMTALDLDPHRPEVRLSLAITLAGTGKNDEAINELRKALDARPAYDDARRRLGQLLARQGKIDEAVVEFERAIALRPTFWRNYADLGRALFDAARYPDAARAFETQVALQPDSFLGFQQLGTVYQAMGQPDEAIENYQRSILIRPSLGALSNMGALYHLRGKYEKAIEAYRQAIALRPNVAGTYRNLGDAYAKLGRTREARAAYLSAVQRVEAELEVNPNNPPALAALAVYLAKSGQHDSATRRIQEAQKLAPNDVQVLARAATVDALSGRVDSALVNLQHAIAAGYSRTEIAADDDLASLRNLAPYKRLTSTQGAK